MQSTVEPVASVGLTGKTTHRTTVLPASRTGSSCTSPSPRPNSSRRSTPRSRSWPAKCASRASVPARRPANCSKRGSAPTSHASRHCRTRCRSTTSKRSNEHDVDVIAPPEIEITAGQEDGDVEFDAVVEIRPQVRLVGYDELRVEVPFTARRRRRRRQAGRRAARTVRRSRRLRVPADRRRVRDDRHHRHDRR